LNIHILIPTASEARRVITALRMKRKDGSSFWYEAPGVCVTLHHCGIGADNARRTAERVFDAGADLLVLAGFCGGLNQNLKLGDAVVDNQHTVPGFVEQISSIAGTRGIPCHTGTILTSSTLVTGPEEKATLGIQTGAIAVDMEGAGVLDLCREKNVPFLSFRTVSDDINQRLARMIHEVALQGKTTVRFWVTLLLVPWEWPDILREVLSARKAAVNLAAVLSDWVHALPESPWIKIRDFGAGRAE